jgi:pimeloyl-CoA dehydrogenase small subunit
VDFDLSEEQQLLKDSVDRLMADRYTFEKRKAHQASTEGWSRDLWARYAELGLLALPFAEQDGGFGGGPVETMLVMEAFGRALALEPYFACVILAGGVLRRAASQAQREALIAEIAAGQTILALAHNEQQARYDLFDVATTARRDGDAFVLEGEKGLVLHGERADKLIVSARTAGARRDRSGIGLFLVAGDAPGLNRRGYPTQDGARAAEIALAGVRVAPDDVIGDPAGGLTVLESVADEAIAALCAEAVGAMQEALTETVAYLKTRKQFGVTIGSFQALQHRASDMFVALEQARSMACYAAMMANEPNIGERRKAMSAAKAQIGQSARFIGQESIQLHGGMGMTMETRIGHLFKRLSMIERQFGDIDYHLEKLAETDGFVGDLSSPVKRSGTGEGDRA